MSANIVSNSWQKLHANMHPHYQEYIIERGRVSYSCVTAVVTVYDLLLLVVCL